MDCLLAFALPPDWQIALVFGLLVAAVILFAIEWVPVDLLTLILLLVLVGSGILTARDAFAGMSSDIIIMLGSLFVLGAALRETGVLDAVGARLIRFARGGENRLALALLSVVGGLSAFMNNTTVTALFVGPVISMAQKARISPSRLLLPVAYASILGGTCTLIGTSTNVAVSGYMERVASLEPLGLFEITPIGAILLFIGVLYLTFVGRHFLPSNPEESLTEDFAIRDYLSEIVVLPKSQLVGQRVFQSDLSRMDFRILKIIRGPQTFVPDHLSVIERGDTLLVTGRVENLMKVKTTEGIEIKPDFRLRDQDLQDEDTQIAEALVTPDSNLVGRTLRESNFHQESGVTVLAVYRQGRSLREQIGSIRLRVGDLVLVQGHKARLQALTQRRELAVLQELSSALRRPRKAVYASALFIGALVLGGLELVPVSLAFLGAAIGVLLLRCLPIERAYDFVDWRLLILIGGMTAFGTAMERTGAAALMAGIIVDTLQPLGTRAILAGFFVVTVLLTQPMSNAAAALVVLPVALESAQVLGANERTFAIGIMLAASVSFIAPFEPSCILVYGPGKYRFADFVKSGFPLTVILIGVVLVLLPVFWPLENRPGVRAAQPTAPTHQNSPPANK